MTAPHTLPPFSLTKAQLEVLDCILRKQLVRDSLASTYAQYKDARNLRNFHVNTVRAVLSMGLVELPFDMSRQSLTDAGRAALEGVK
jgi:hypothetical protein